MVDLSKGILIGRGRVGIDDPGCAYEDPSTNRGRCAAALPLTLDTPKDEHGKPKGWCWFCYQDHLLHVATDYGQTVTKELEKYRATATALYAALHSIATIIGPPALKRDDHGGHPNVDYIVKRIAQDWSSRVCGRQSERPRTAMKQRRKQ